MLPVDLLNMTMEKAGLIAFKAKEESKHCRLTLQISRSI